MKKHSKKVKKEHIKKEETFFEVDSLGWRHPEQMSIGDLGEILDIDSSSNVISYKFKDQDTNPTLPPDAQKLSNLDLAADDNFLYVWVKNRWKRIPLSEF